VRIRVGVRTDVEGYCEVKGTDAELWHAEVCTLSGAMHNHGFRRTKGLGWTRRMRAEGINGIPVSMDLLTGTEHS
jgi:hypothetical protein